MDVTAIPYTEAGPLAPLALFAVGVLTCLGLGGLVVGALRLGGGGRALRLALALTAGMGALGLYVFAVGMLGWLGRLPTLLLLPVLLAAWPAWRELRRLGRPRLRLTPTRALLGAFLAASGAVGLLSALAPAAANDWDGLSYHLAVPALWLRQGGIHYLPWLSHSNFPFLQEMLYLAGLAVSGQGLAKLCHLLAGGVAALALYAATRPRLGATGGLLAAAVFASAPLVALEAGTGMSDLALAMYLAVAAACWLAWRDGHGDRWLAAAGLMLGGALGVKVTAAVAGMVLLVLVALRHGRVPSHRKLGRAARLGLLLAPALLVAWPWYVKSWLWTGNPTYPFLYELFGGRYWSLGFAQGYRAEQLSFGLGRGLGALVLLPWNLTMHPGAFGNFPTQPLIYSSLGPLFLALSPLALVLAWRSPLVRFAALLAAGWLGTWFVLSQHLRYAIPALVPLSMLAAVAGSRLVARPGLLRAAARAAVGVSLLGSLGIQVFTSADAVLTTLRVRSPQEYLASNLPEYPAFQYLNSLPGESRVMMLGETRGLYLLRDYLWGEHSTYAGLEGVKTTDDLLARLQALEITHLLVSDSYLMANVRARSQVARALARGMFTGRLVPLFSQNGENVLAVRGGRR